MYYAVLTKVSRFTILVILVVASSSFADEPPIPIEDVVNRMPADNRAAFVRNAAEHGLFVFVPDFVRIVTDVKIRLRYLRGLHEPFDDDLLTVFEDVLPSVEDHEVALLIAAYLYSYGRESGRSFLVDRAKSNVRPLSILAMNRDPQVSDIVVTYYQHGEFGRAELPLVLAKMESPAINRVLFDAFERRGQGTYLSLALALAGDRRLETQMLTFERKTEDNNQLYVAAAIARLKLPEMSEQLQYLLDNLLINPAPYGMWKAYVMDALGYVPADASRQAINAYIDTVLSEARDQRHETQTRSLVQALVSLERLWPGQVAEPGVRVLQFCDECGQRDVRNEVAKILLDSDNAEVRKFVGSVVGYEFVQAYLRVRELKRLPYDLLLLRDSIRRRQFP